MTFTYDVTDRTDVERVRFHIGDTIESTAMFEDEEITFAISEEGSYQKAVIACIQQIIARISAEPDFKADWLQVDSSRSLKGYERLLREKRQKFGVSSVSSSAVAVYRSDSLQTEAPDDW